MAKLSFDDLPEDIKAAVVDKILRPTDLKNVCLVNKQLHTLAVKPLYHTVSLDVGGPSDARLPAFLSPSNIGLKHVRQLRLYLPRVEDSANQLQQAMLAVRMIIEFLPPDVLERVTWSPWLPFNADCYLLLLRKQRKMKKLEVMDMDRDILPGIKKFNNIRETVLSEIRKVALYPSNLTVLDACQFFLEKTTDILEYLLVYPNFTPPDPELNDSATGPGLLTRTLFSHMMPFEKCNPFPKLTTLSLYAVSLRHCADTWCKFIDFTKIQALYLNDCLGADTLLGQLCKASHLPKRLKELDIQHKDNAENETLTALDGFLCLVSGIVELAINMETVKALPAPAGIARHGKTLKMLLVHCSPSNNQLQSSSGEVEQHVWSTEDFHKICKACPQIEQLSCAWPETSLIRSPTDSWKAFEDAIATNLRNMVTLQIPTFPSNQPSPELLPMLVHEQLLQGLAQRVFSLVINNRPKNEANATTNTEENAEESPTSDPPTSDRGKLRLIAFGISNCAWERHDCKNQSIFLRSTCQSALGEQNIYAAPISWCQRLFVEPRSSVLDATLSWVTMRPCRENDQGDWSD